MAKCQPRIGLVVMIGLPGSGKTTLSKRLDQLATVRSGDSEPQHVHRFTYDELIPASVQSGKDSVSWKQARDAVKERVEHIVCQLQDATSLKETNLGDSKQDTLLIIDDNMYYRSMRYEYFQLARKFGLSFCQVNVSATVDQALRCNRSRRDSVPEHVIHRMSQRLQPPDTEHNVWERLSLTVVHGDVNAEAVHNFVTSSLEHPVQPVAESTSSVPPSLVHTVDLQLRKLVGHMMRDTSDDKLVGHMMRDTSDDKLVGHMMRDTSSEKLVGHMMRDTSGKKLVGHMMRDTSSEKQTLRANALNLQRQHLLARLRAGDVEIPTENIVHFLTQQLTCDDDYLR